jgi:gluconokinase
MPIQSLVIMGVAGCGKSTLAAQLAHDLGFEVIEGDDHHSQQNREKMRSGIALTDADRADWLDSLAESLRRRPEGLVVTCSALRRVYRDRLRLALPALRFVHLEIGHAEAIRRVTSRGSHFFGPGLVDSQFATLESPEQEPRVLCLNATEPAPDLAAKVGAWIT